MQKGLDKSPGDQIDCIQTDINSGTQWAELKKPGTYASDLADVAMVAIARGC